MLYLACTTISSVDLAQYGVSLAKDWVSVECGTIYCYCVISFIIFSQNTNHLHELQPFCSQNEKKKKKKKKKKNS